MLFSVAAVDGNKADLVRQHGAASQRSDDSAAKVPFENKFKNCPSMTASTTCTAMSQSTCRMRKEMLRQRSSNIQGRQSPLSRHPISPRCCKPAERQLSRKRLVGFCNGRMSAMGRYLPLQTPDRVQGQTASGPCRGVSREGKSLLWSQPDRLPGGAGGVANDDPATGDERGGRNLPFSG